MIFSRNKFGVILGVRRQGMFRSDELFRVRKLPAISKKGIAKFFTSQFFNNFD